MSDRFASDRFASDRCITLVLVDGAGRRLGALAAFPVSVPYWPETAEIVEQARTRFGLDVAVLRILATERLVPHGGAVTYLGQIDPAQLRRRLELTPVEVDLSPHPLRAPYAQRGGPAASLEWARRALAARGDDPVLDWTQQRTWNLSAIWRLQTPRGPVWLKQVPRFFGHEPRLVTWLAGHGFAASVPHVLAHDGERMLLDHIAGEDLYGAPDAVRVEVAGQLHPIQVHASNYIDDLRHLGVPDHRPAELIRRCTDVVRRHGAGEPRLANLVAGLAERLRRVTECGLPDTLVHGDLHPGNVRGEVTGGTGSRVIIDWGDSSVGHPAFDVLRLSEDAAAPDALLAGWADQWRSTVPGCDPLTAVDLLRPVAALRAAATYAAFLDQIEPSEHAYHAADVPYWLTRAADLAPA
ncbi:MAG: phosphotransferase family protein [Micromonosporaceae bacterium]